MNNLYNLLCRNESAESILQYLEANSFEQTVLNKNLHLVEEGNN